MSVQIGVEHLVFAELLTDPVGGTATYGTPERVPGLITAGINPNYASETLFADNGPFETSAALGKIELSLTVADLPLELQAKMFGHTITGGVLSRKSTDIAPWMAVGFKSLMSNGKYRYTWLNKGKFALPEQKNDTKADKIAFQTPQAMGSFVARESDGEWERHIDEGSATYTADQGTNWFNNPFGTAV